jgi:hypothetical protein
LSVLAHDPQQIMVRIVRHSAAGYVSGKSILIPFAHMGTRGKNGTITQWRRYCLPGEMEVVSRDSGHWADDARGLL